MSIYKEISQHTSKGLCFVNGNKLVGWKVPFGMPYLQWDTGSATWADGFVSSRLTETSCYNLSGMYHGMEVSMNDIVWRYCVTNGSCLCGSGGGYWTIISPTGVCTVWQNGATMNIDVQAPGIGYTWTLYQSLGVAGIDESDEFHANGTICFRGCATSTSGDDISIGINTICATVTNTPTLCDLNTCGSMWVDGNNLYYTGARGWRHYLCGDCCGSSNCNATPGSVWIEGNMLRWSGTTAGSTTVHNAPWAICEFCSAFTGGINNPSPGAAYAGAIWTDNRNWGGWVNLAYIGCDGNKYIVANGNLPNVTP